jgi:hypothetical protein
MEDPVVVAVQVAFSARIKNSADVSDVSRSAQGVEVMMVLIVPLPASERQKGMVRGAIH